ncbi:MAG TPA: hypothetical protein EYP28_06530 [Methanophagales archaeon]|nr:hypothetical protein [Methanophagales archaeon]
MYNHKKMLLFIALVSAIMVAMPNTISMFGGQHTLPREITCDRCHLPPEEGLSSLELHQNLDGGDEACAVCHRCDLTYYARGNGTRYCIECHEIGSWYTRAEGFTNKI